MLTLSYVQLVDLCKRRLGKFDVACPLCGPDRRSRVNRKREVLRIWHEEPGFASFNCARCGERGYAHDGSPSVGQTSFRRRVVEDDNRDAEERARIALQIWSASVTLTDTLGCRYLLETRGLQIGSLDLEHCLRWHQGIGAVVGLMTDPRTNEPIGVQRTFINPDGTKRQRKMLGRQGVVRLSPDDEVTQGLSIAEGTEDGIAIFLSGWAPVWSATSAGAIERFPVLAGIEALTIFRDDEPNGIQAAEVCASRWVKAGREVSIASLNGGV
jgi:hypothetical protein